MTYTPEQKKVIDAVLSIFETGKVPTPESYQTCTILTDGAGISYGKHQSTDKSDSLDQIVELYIKNGGKHAEELKQYLPRLKADETATLDPKNPPAWAKYLVGVLKECGKDPVMQSAQDEVFDKGYFTPAVNIAKEVGLTKALSLLVIYDTCIHSGPGRVATHRAAFPEKSPKNGGDEKAWVLAYIKTRRAWLLANKNPLVQKCVYRQDALVDLINADNWDLKTPCKVRGVLIK
jgi:chitosanase